MVEGIPVIFFVGGGLLPILEIMTGIIMYVDIKYIKTVISSKMR